MYGTQVLKTSHLCFSSFERWSKYSWLKTDGIDKISAVLRTSRVSENREWICAVEKVMICHPTVGVSAAGGSFGRGVPALLQVCSECGRSIYQTKSFEGIRPTLVLYNYYIIFFCIVCSVPKNEMLLSLENTFQNVCKVLKDSFYRQSVCRHPWLCLFLWAVLQNRGEMAIFCWEMVSYYH